MNITRFEEILTIDRSAQYDRPTADAEEAMLALENCLSHHLGGACAEVNLLLAVIKSAAKENDLDYFAGKLFKKHCKLLGLDASQLLHSIKNKKLIEENESVRFKIKKIQKREEEIKEMFFTQKATKRDIANKFGVEVYLINKVLRGLDNGVKTLHYNPEDVLRDRKAGFSFRALILKYRISSETVRKIIYR